MNEQEAKEQAVEKKGELLDHIELTYGTPKDGQVKFKTYFDASDEKAMGDKVNNTFILMDTLKKAHRIQ